VAGAAARGKSWESGRVPLGCRSAVRAELGLTAHRVVSAAGPHWRGRKALAQSTKRDRRWPLVAPQCGVWPIDRGESSSGSRSGVRGRGGVLVVLASADMILKSSVEISGDSHPWPNSPRQFVAFAIEGGKSFGIESLLELVRDCQSRGASGGGRCRPGNVFVAGERRSGRGHVARAVNNRCEPTDRLLPIDCSTRRGNSCDVHSVDINPAGGDQATRLFLGIKQLRPTLQPFCSRPSRRRSCRQDHRDLCAFEDVANENSQIS